MHDTYGLRTCAAFLSLPILLGVSVALGSEPDGSAESDNPSAGGNALQEIVVTAQRTTVEQAREAQLVAPNLINIATYTEIRKLPDISTGEAVRRVPGVSLETDEGEGRYVNIRGFDADLNSTTFGGLRLPPTNNASPFGGYRAVTLDSIPIGLVGALTVTKTNIPSQDAEALGGTIEITPKTAPPGGVLFAEGAAGSGYEPLRRKPVYDFAITTGGRFGGPGRPAGSSVDAYSDRPFSVVLTYSFNENWRGIDDVEPAYFNDSAHPYYAISNIQQRDYELNRKRHGYGIDLGYQPDPDNQYYIRAFDAGYTERYYRQFLNLNPDGNTVDLGNGLLQDTLSTGNSGAAPIEKAFRDEKETSKDQVAMVGGRNDFDGVVLDYRLGYTKGTWSKAYDYNSAFDYMNPNGLITYGLTGRGHTPIYTITGANYLDPTNFGLTGFSNSTADNFDREHSAVANLEIPIHWGGFDAESLKGGVSARLRHKRTTSNPASYGTLPGLLLSDVASSPDEVYYASQYQNGVDIRPGLLQSLLGSGSPMTADQVSSLQQYLDAKEDVYAAYIMYQMTAGHFGLLGGVRVERTKDSEDAFGVRKDQNGNYPLDANGNVIGTPIHASSGYTNAFPSVQLRYEIQPTLIGRATWSSTIARPGFNQSNASQTVDLGSGTVTEGNPNLKPATANSFDLDIEKYLPKAGILSLGLFDKQIANYIVARNTARVQDPVSGLLLYEYTYANAGGSYARGAEFNWEQRFTGLPWLLSGLGASANYTFVDSRFEIRPGEHSRLPSTSKETWNASIFYEQSGLALRVAAYSVSADLFGIGTDKTSDIYNAHRTSMDFGSSYAFSKQLSMYFNIKNLLNTPHAFYLGTPDRPIQREFYSQDYLLGVRYDFEGH